MNILGEKISTLFDKPVYNHLQLSDCVVKVTKNPKEYEILMDLYHDNIIRPIDIIQEIDNYYIILPKLDKFDIIPSYRQITELLDAIHYIYNKKIRHFDIHSGNIMINKKTDKLILIDFGNSYRITDNDKIDMELNSFARTIIVHIRGLFYPEIYNNKDLVSIMNTLYPLLIPFFIPESILEFAKSFSYIIN